ncbi:MAG: Rieske (2Fe-2S) protein [Pseudomonadota bacterium]|nr:Rieske (2Fe-2S) protein [Pseudomonadota bacterium]
MARHVVARAADIPPGGRKLVMVGKRRIGVFNLGGTFFALHDRCPHQGGALCEGHLVGMVDATHPGEYRRSREGELLKCPWHGWMFDIRTGQSWCDPGTMFVRRFEVSVEPGEALARGPYVAETFPVVIEDEYVVVEA